MLSLLRSGNPPAEFGLRLANPAATHVTAGRCRVVIQEPDIVRMDEDTVTYRWRNGKTQAMEYRTVPGEQFLALVLQHVLPKGFRRARNYGFLHPNSKLLTGLHKLLVFKPVPGKPPTVRPVLKCLCCGSTMRIVERMVPAGLASRASAGPPGAGSAAGGPDPRSRQELGTAGSGAQASLQLQRLHFTPDLKRRRPALAAAWGTQSLKRRNDAEIAGLEALNAPING